MDIVELVENVCGAKINKYQKPFLHGQIFTYINQKELSQNGNTNICK